VHGQPRDIRSALNLIERGRFSSAPAGRLGYFRSDPAHSGHGQGSKESAMNKDHRTFVQALVAALLPLGAWAGPVNVNTADASTLAQELDGIGPARAQAIVEYRQKNGPFRAPEDLLKVQGIGERVLEQNRSNLRFSGAGAAAPAAAKASATPQKPPVRR
jgi:competence protein ComEA